MTRRLFYSFLLTVLASVQFSARADSALAKSAVLENDVAYFRVSAIEQDLAAELQSARTGLLASNKIHGIVLDLRFANGENSNSAKLVTDLFSEKKLPLAILVNDQTGGAALELAKSLRSARDGLIFGNSTEIKPDLVVNVKPAAEKEFFENPYAVIARETKSGETNRFLSFVERVSEADLVRAKIKDGQEAENFQPRHAVEPSKPVLRDPVLARAVDLMRGLAVIHASRS